MPQLILEAPTKTKELGFMLTLGVDGFYFRHKTVKIAIDGTGSWASGACSHVYQVLAFGLMISPKR